MNERRSVRVFLNGRSGGGPKAEELRALFSAHGVACQVTELSPRLDVARLAAEDEPTVIWVAGGGDGTVNAIARAIAGSGRAMAVLPCGTLNHFARDLGVPANVDEAVKIIATGPVRVVDAAEVNGIVFVNNSGLGVYPAMVLDRERMKKGGGNKWIALALASTRAFFRFRSLHVEIELEGGLREFKTPLIFIGNNAYRIEGGRLGCRDHLDRGLLALYLVPDTTRLNLLRLAAGALIGRVHGATTLVEFHAREFTVRTKRHRRLRVSFDGEVRRMPPPLVYRALPGALCVIAPAHIAPGYIAPSHIAPGYSAPGYSAPRQGAI